jgi:hypothetical protein
MKALAAGFVAVVLLAACTSVGTGKWSDNMYVTSVDDFSGYKGWMKVNDEPITGDSTGALGPAHEGATGFRDVFINHKGSAPFEVGTILVKESRKTRGGDITSLTVMVKRAGGYDPANRNWEYVMTSPAFDVAAQGKVDMCIGCHTAAADTDYVFTSVR